MSSEDASERQGPSHASGPAQGRASAGASLALAVLVPLLTVLALLRADVDATTEAESPQRSPRVSALSRATLVCPGLDAPVTVSTAGTGRGAVTLTTGAQRRRVRVRADRLSTSDLGAAARRPVTVTGLDDLAPGLVAARLPRSGPPASPTCSPPESDQWFTGLGASARHASVIELVNPDRGTAVADVVLHGPDGELAGLAAQRLRGISVPGRSRVRRDLAQVVPGRGVLSAHVTTSRGRVSTAVLDRVGLPGVTPTSREWLAAQSAPLTSSLLLGIPPGDGRRQLVLTNTSPDQTRVAVGAVTDAAVIAPEGVDDLTVEPMSTLSVGLDDVLPRRLLRDAVGLEVESTQPVTATLRSVVDGDLCLTPAGGLLSDTSTTVVVAPGDQQLLVAGATSLGSVAVLARDGQGKDLGTKRADLVPGRGRSIELPGGTRLLEVRLRGTAALASVLLTRSGAGAGSAVLGLRDLERTGLVADVRPAPG